jgi:hypothetical protein
VPEELTTHSPTGPASGAQQSAAIDRWTVSGPGARLKITARVVQIALGLIWILDGALQLQPVMWHRGFVTGTILPMAAGQPAPIGWLITNVGHFILPDIGVWNFLFAAIQLGIGFGLLFRRTVRPALAVSFVWCIAVWWIGEGFGMLLTGTATPLTGAPGAVILYAAIGLLVWPKRNAAGADETEAAQTEPPVGVASSAAGRGPLRAFGAHALWTTFWVGSAILWLLPANRMTNSLSSGISRAAAGQPGWYAHFLSTFAGHFSSIGVQGVWVLAIASLVIGIGPLLVSRPTAFLALGATLQVVLWVTGMALGGLLTGSATDPNVGPLIVLLAFAMLPTVVPVRASVRTPIASMLRWNRATTWGVGAGVGAMLLLSATYPVAAASSASAPTSHASVATAKSSSSSSSMSGMSGMSGMSATSAKSTKKSGDMVNMEAAAGLGVEDPDWSYAGPALPATEVSELESVGATTDEGHAMQTPDCTTKPTANQVLGAMEYVQSTTDAVAKYKDLNVAVAAGYRPITSTAYPVVHYINLSYMNTADTLDPNHVQSLVYAFTPYGPVLVAAMYLMPSVNAKGPMPYGCLVQWHAHTNLCYSLKTGTIVGFTPCAVGTYNERTPVMTHVWQVPVPGGPLALDPSDLQTVEAAIQAQQDGMAPTTTPLPTASSTSSATVGAF